MPSGKRESGSKTPSSRRNWYEWPGFATGGRLHERMSDDAGANGPLLLARAQLYARSLITIKQGIASKCQAPKTVRHIYKRNALICNNAQGCGKINPCPNQH